MRECHLARPSVPHSHCNTTSDLLTLPPNALQHLNIMTLIQFLPGLTLPAPQLQWRVCVCSVLSNSFATLWAVAHQAALSMGFSRQEYWRGLPFPPPGNVPMQGSNPHLLHWQVNSLPLCHLGSPPLHSEESHLTKPWWYLPVFTYFFALKLEKAMAPHSSTLA